jgi:hypothetical protein
MAHRQVSSWPLSRRHLADLEELCRAKAATAATRMPATAAHLLTEHVPGRYSFHDLLRDYAAEQAVGTGT